MPWDRNIQEKLRYGVEYTKKEIKRARRHVAFLSYLAANMTDTEIVGAEMQTPYSSIWDDPAEVPKLVFKVAAHEKNENGYGKYDYHVGLRNIMRRFNIQTMKRSMTSALSNRPEWYFEGIGQLGGRQLKIEFRLESHVPLGCKVQVVRRRRTWSTSVQYSASCGVR